MCPAFLAEDQIKMAKEMCSPQYLPDPWEGWRKRLDKWAGGIDTYTDLFNVAREIPEDVMDLFADLGALLSAFASNDAWEISEAMGGIGALALGLIVTLGGGVLVLILYRFVPLIDRHLECTVMVWTYLIIAGIILVEVFRRFVLSQQAPWSTTLPPFLFLIMTWFGCAYNVRLRTHLSFSEFRTNLPRFGQLICLTLNAVLWLVLCWIVIVTSAKVTANSASNLQILLGTDDTLQWWFLVTVPIASTPMVERVLENFLEDLRNYRSGEPLIKQAVIGAD